MTENASRKNVLALWAKRSTGSDGLESTHPLVCHAMDVAAVAEAMWSLALPAAGRAGLSRGLGVDPDTAQRWIALLAGLHDLGKASPAFQSQHPAARVRLAGLGLPFAASIRAVPHGTITAAKLPDLLADRFRLGQEIARRAGTATGGHHGIFPRSKDVVDLNFAGASSAGGTAWDAIRASVLDSLAAVVGLPTVSLPRHLDNSCAMLISGLVSVADWIGSNLAYFPHAAGSDGPVLPLDLGTYWGQARARARTALEDLGWAAWPAAVEPRTFREVFPRFAPRPVQAEVERLASGLEAPAAVIIEAPTGDGKTEAAMYLAHAWAASAGLRGAYFALPTRATSNQMFQRVRTFLADSLPGTPVLLQLMHGHASLSADFLALLDRGRTPPEPADLHGEGSEPVAQTSVRAGEWFTYRKRGLLAPYGVGTVDQALLAALQTRHVFVRLFGLAHKTVIVDEVHAYDTYMSTLLERLLEWLGAIGSPVVLLSATLPRSRSAALLRAYARGFGRGEPPAPLEAAYPRITWVSATAAGARHVPASDTATKVVRIEGLPTGTPPGADLSFPGERLRLALEGGGCAAVVCNTVRRAQELYRALKPYFPGRASDGLPELDLLHARYVFADRDIREARVLSRFGKTGAEQRRPDRAVLVATQVVEQSLDLDFDLMVTDLAPTDLILQRMGRLHRHDRPRPPGLGFPALWLCLPPFDDDGVPVFSPGDAAVYSPHVLLRTWLQLRDRSTIRVPEDADALIEEVYGDRAAPASLSPGLRRMWEETAAAQAKALQAESHEAQGRWLRPPTSAEALWRFTSRGLEEDAPELHEAFQALTRLADPSVDAVLLHDTPRGPALDREGLEAVDLDGRPAAGLAGRLLRRSLTITGWGVVRELLATPVPAGWAKSALLRRHRQVSLDPSGKAMVGPYVICYDSDAGLTVAKDSSQEA